jgi:hypothetical protein
VALTAIGLAFACGFSVVAGQTNARPEVQGRSSCTPYDPAGLKISETAGGYWDLRRSDDAILRIFGSREDAEAGIAVARDYNQYCVIGKASFQQTRNAHFLMEYWVKK